MNLPRSVISAWGTGFRWTIKKDQRTGHWVIFSPSWKVPCLSYGFSTFELARESFAAGGYGRNAFPSFKREAGLT